MIGVAVVGLGEIGQFHLPAVRQHPDANLIAVCDLDIDLAARSAQSGEIASDDLASLLERPDIDVVDICLPHNLHLPVALEALAAGRDVLLEKPMAIGLSGCQEILDAAATAGKQVAVSHNQLFYQPHVKLIEMAASGALGQLQSMRARLGIGGKYGAWRTDPERVGGGLLMDAGAHRIYMLLALGGAVRKVSAVMDNPRAEDRFVVTLEFESGAIGVADGSYHGPNGVFDDRIEVFGQLGLAEVSGCEAFFEGYLPEGPRLRRFEDGVWSDLAVSGSWDESVRDSVQAALSAFASGAVPPVDGRAGYETIRVIEAAYEAAQSGSSVEL